MLTWPAWLLLPQWVLAALVALALTVDRCRGPLALPFIAGGTAARSAWADRTTFTRWWDRWRAWRSNTRGTALDSPQLAQLGVERAEAFLAAAAEREAAGWEEEPISRGTKVHIALDLVWFLLLGAPFLLVAALLLTAAALQPADWERRRAEAARPSVLRSLEVNRRVLQQQANSAGEGA